MIYFNYTYVKIFYGSVTYSFTQLFQIAATRVSFSDIQYNQQLFQNTKIKLFLKHNVSFQLKVLEAKERVGGRTLTVTLKTATGTDQWDLGGQWVGLTQPDLLNLMKELGKIKRDLLSTLMKI